MAEATTIAEALARAQALLRSGPAPDDARLEAEVLLAHALGARGRDAVYRRAPGDRLSAEEAERLRLAIERRAGGEPVAYILGRREFFSLDLAVAKGVLIPRPETETLVEAALARLHGGGHARGAGGAGGALVADIGCGSGAVAVALAVTARVRVIATDISPVALDLTAGNARRHGVADLVETRRGDLLEPLADLRGRLAAIVSNPPYVALGAPLPPDVRCEPPEALFAGPDGLDAIRRLVASSAAYLEPGGFLAFEMGAGQGAAARELLRAAGYGEVAVLRDLAGIERVAIGGR